MGHRPDETLKPTGARALKRSWWSCWPVQFIVGYEGVRCRALAVYALADSVVDVVPYYRELDSAGRARADSVLGFVQRVTAYSRDRIAHLPTFKVVGIHHSNHFVFLQYPREVAEVMRKFLGAKSEAPRPNDR